MATKLPAVVGKFRLREKCGTHTEPGDNGVWFVQPGQVVEGRSDLSKRFPEKFDHVDNDRKITASFIKNNDQGNQETLAHHVVHEEPTERIQPDSPEAPKGPSKENLDTFETYKVMTVAELKEQAADQELDLKDARNKKDILDVFAKSLGITSE